MCNCESYNRPDWGGADPSVVVQAPSGKDVCIDPCILPVVEALWAAGIETLSSCCGHNGSATAHMVLARVADVVQAHGIISARATVPMHVIVWSKTQAMRTEGET